MASWYSGFGEDYGDGTDLDRMAYYIEETPGLNLRNAYGVHGGLLGLSEALENQGEVGMATEWLSDFKYPATVVSFVAGGVGAVFGLIGIIAGTSSAFGPIGLVVAAVAAIVVLIVQFVTSGGKSETVTVTANCESWVPPSGGDFCELCDLPVSQGGLALDDGSGDVLPGYECTEYKCKSLGAACDYISENAGTEREKCFNAHINDVNHPIIEIDEEIFQKYEYTYNLDGTNGVSVTGVQPYTQFHYGIITDELSQCRIDTEPIESFDEMAEMFPDSYYSKNHNQTRVLTPDEEFNYYIRCQDPVGNWNINAFVMKVTTTAGEDVQAPMIESTDIASGSYIAADVSTPVVTIYLNEPTEECRWSYSDQEFDLMENYFIYGTGSIATQSAYYENYRAAVLNVTELGENYFYFACKDLAGNINSQNYAFVLKGTEPLNIDRTSPNGTVYYNDVALQVETSVGAENGKSVCYYDGIEFFASNTSYHEQLLEDLSAGQYSYNILCQDVAGNQNSTTISFTVDIDTNAPGLGNVYVDEAFNSLVFETDEPATCEYLYEPFAFGEGTATSGTIALTDIQTYYIICEDEFGNQGSFTIEI